MRRYTFPAGNTMEPPYTSMSSTSGKFRKFIKIVENWSPLSVEPYSRSMCGRFDTISNKNDRGAANFSQRLPDGSVSDQPLTVVCVDSGAQEFFCGAGRQNRSVKNDGCHTVNPDFDSA